MCEKKFERRNSLKKYSYVTNVLNDIQELKF